MTTTPQQTGANNGVGDTRAPESIDQVRDLLFGAQLRAIDARIQSLDDHVRAESQAIRAELRESVSALDARISSELGRLTSQLQSDKLDRSALAAGLTELANRITGDSATVKKQATSDRA